tara:strand:- start:293 stop:532 length:240 start_codon:yes stop_codon:yes gene_type:complete
MSLLSENITERIQEQIYIITAKLGSVPSKIINFGQGVQVNWVVNGNSYMWRSDNHGEYMNWVEVYDGKSDPYNFNVSDL